MIFCQEQDWTSKYDAFSILYIVHSPEIAIVFGILTCWSDCWKLNNKKYVFVHDISFLDNQQPKFVGLGNSIFISTGMWKWDKMSPKAADTLHRYDTLNFPSVKYFIKIKWQNKTCTIVAQAVLMSFRMEHIPDSSLVDILLCTDSCLKTITLFFPHLLSCVLNQLNCNL